MIIVLLVLALLAMGWLGDKEPGWPSRLTPALLRPTLDSAAGLVRAPGRQGRVVPGRPGGRVEGRSHRRVAFWRQGINAAPRAGGHFRTGAREPAHFVLPRAAPPLPYFSSVETDNNNAVDFSDNYGVKIVQYVFGDVWLSWEIKPNRIIRMFLGSCNYFHHMFAFLRHGL